MNSGINPECVRGRELRHGVYLEFYEDGRLGAAKTREGVIRKWYRSGHLSEEQREDMTRLWWWNGQPLSYTAGDLKLRWDERGKLIETDSSKPQDIPHVGRKVYTMIYRNMLRAQAERRIIYYPEGLSGDGNNAL